MLPARFGGGSIRMAAETSGNSAATKLHGKLAASCAQPAESMKKTLLLILAAAVLAGAAFGVYRYTSNKGSAPD